jgi:hypothetical protein
MGMTSELAGIRKYLKRTKSLAQLQTLADDLYSIADSEVTITSTGFEGGSTSGQARKYSKADILNLVEDLIEDLAPSAEPTIVRSAGMVYADWSEAPVRL